MQQCRVVKSAESIFVSRAASSRFFFFFFSNGRVNDFHIALVVVVMLWPRRPTTQASPIEYWQAGPARIESIGSIRRASIDRGPANETADHRPPRKDAAATRRPSCIDDGCGPGPGDNNQSRRVVPTSGKSQARWGGGGGLAAGVDGCGRRCHPQGAVRRPGGHGTHTFPLAHDAAARTRRRPITTKPAAAVCREQRAALHMHIHTQPSTD